MIQNSKIDILCIKTGESRESGVVGGWAGTTPTYMWNIRYLALIFKFKLKKFENVCFGHF